MSLVKSKQRVADQSFAFSEEGSLFAQLGKHEIFTPAKTYPPMTVSELAAVAPGGNTPPTNEVFTPPEFANGMLDTLAGAWAANHGGANLWAD